MKLKITLMMKTPFVYSPSVPLDGTLSFLIALRRGFDLEGKQGEFEWGNFSLPVGKYGYLLDLEKYLRVEEIGEKRFFRISVPFAEKVKVGYTKIFRKVPSFTGKFAESNLAKSDYLRIMGSGKMRGIVRPIKTFYAKEIWFYADVVDGKEEEFVELVELFKESGIGKKTTHGYGEVEEVVVEETDEFDGLFVKMRNGNIPSRPLPEEIEVKLPEGFYPVKLYSSLLPPYYLPVSMAKTTFCYPQPLGVEG